MFKNIKAKNFQSWENLEFDLKDGVTLIEGFNYDDNSAEGCGKSAILNALCWGLFGKLPKDANTDDVIKEGKKSCKVEVLLENGYKVLRSRKPNDITIVHGSDVVKGTNAKETQKLIEELIGVSYGVFTQSVYFAQNDSNNFVNSKEEDRVSILSQILNLDKFDKARELTLKKSRKLEPQRIRLETKVESLKLSIDSLEKESKKIAEVYANRKSKLKEKLEELGRKRKETADLGAQLSAEHKSVEKALSNYKDDESKELQLREHLTELKTERSSKLKNEQIRESIRERIRRLLKSAENKSSKIEGLQKSLDQGECPTCGATLTAHNSVEKDISHVKTDLKSDIKEIEDLEAQLEDIPEIDTSEYDALLTQLTADLKGIEKSKLEVKSKKEQISRLEVNQAKIINSLDNIDRTYEELSQELEHLDSKMFEEKSEYEERLTVKSEELKSMADDYKAIKDAVSKLETLKRSFKEIKYYTFDNILAELTARTNKYLLELFETPVQCEIKRDDSGTKIAINITIDNISRKFGLFSGGQSRRIQLAVDLALGDIVANRSDKPLRLKIFDEYFKDLSESSMSRILHLFERVDVPTLMIEHNSLFKTLVNNKFEVEYKNGTSRSL